MLKVKKPYDQLLGQLIPTLVDSKGVCWYPAADVCAILGFKNPSDAVKNHTKSSQTRKHIRGKAGQQKSVLLINEAGLHRLLLKSKSPAAIALTEKVTDVILPTIRKYGCYLKGIDEMDGVDALEAVKDFVFDYYGYCETRYEE